MNTGKRIRLVGSGAGGIFGTRDEHPKTRTYRYKDLFKEVMLRNPEKKAKKEGYLEQRFTLNLWGLGFRVH